MTPRLRRTRVDVALGRPFGGGLAGLVLAVTGWISPALALSQRGHVVGFSFRQPGEGVGEFRFGGASFEHEEAAGVAVSEATGEVYVVDRGNDRVEQFRPQLGVGGELVGRNSSRRGVGGCPVAKANTRCARAAAGRTLVVSGRGS